MPGLSATRGHTLPRTCSWLLTHGFQGLWEEACSPFCVLRVGLGAGSHKGPNLVTLARLLEPHNTNYLHP